jgi:predicted RNA-binding protein YlxR (DUF448 family)
VKFILDDGFIVLDKGGKAGGRSGYSCKNTVCMKKFLQDKKSQFKAFKLKDCRISRELKDWE